MPEIQFNETVTPLSVLSIASETARATGLAPSVIARAIDSWASDQMRRIPQFDFPIVDGQLIVGGSTTPLASCPPDAVAAREYQRAPWEKRDRFGMSHVLAVYDSSGTPQGSFAVSSDPADEGQYAVATHHDALAAAGMPLLTPMTEYEVTGYLAQAPALFAPDGDITTNTGMSLSTKDVPIEAGVRLAAFLGDLQHDEATRKRLYRFLAEMHHAGLSILPVIQDSGELVQLLDRYERDPFHVRTLVNGLASVVGGAETVDAYTGRALQGNPIGDYILRRAAGFFRGTLAMVDRKNFPWEIARHSLDAFRDTLLDLYRIPLPRKTPDSLGVGDTLGAFAIEHANDPEALATVAPVVDTLALRALGSYVPGEYQKRAREFYQEMGDHLYRTASETTGSTPEELRRFRRIFEWLGAKGRLPVGWKMADFGAGPGDRILRPLLRSFRQEGYAPGEVVAVDQDWHPEPPDGLWRRVQADFAQKGFAKVVGGPFHAALHAWSPLNDLSGQDEERSLRNFHEVLEPSGVVVADLAMGYDEERKIHHSAHPDIPYGTITREFQDGAGVVRGKPFHIPSWPELLVRTSRAGLRPLNFPARSNPLPDVPPIWITPSGNVRATLLLQREDVPFDPSIDVVLTGSSA